MTTELEMDVARKESKNSTDIGEVLRAKRLALAVPERQVATELKLPIEKVYALENNHFEQFRSTTFARGYLKSYCRVLEIDHKPILAAFDEQQSDKESNIRPVDKVTHQASIRDPIVVIVSAIIVAIIVFVAFWWPDSFTDEATPKDSIATEQHIDETASDAEPKSELLVQDDTLDQENTLGQGTGSTNDNVSSNAQTLDLSPLSSVEPQSDSSSSDTNDVVTGLSAETIALLEDAGVDPQEVVEATKEPEVVAPPAPKTPPAPAYKSDIYVAFSADCWTEVRDSTGKILYSGVKRSGSTLELNGAAPYRVVLGYAPGVAKFIYKGKTFDFSSHIRKDLARFELE